MSLPRPGPAWRRSAVGAGWAVAALGALLACAGSAPVTRSEQVIVRLGAITVNATALRAGPSGGLTADVQISTSGQPSDELDAAIAAGSVPVGLYHEVVNLGETPDLTSCGGDSAPLQVVDTWLHYGPLLVPGRSVGSVPPADATLTVQPVSRTIGEKLAITLYFARAGALTVELPVERS